ncbi:2-C-methyl-D-erythritol 4-phosphate cytidylyltransferase [Cesiribacter andamanensis]|uniref:2-C-methyl-D-erythritol 4-phosphate cytidylyltransferase n=1 Tax=Cesiribacter andamanensis AMV16 TaxID=1279009 RepID=M7NTE7_9BACT|nr:2-C-methyl-D-erythritol 4-phosphate cytidylyltransferase [Cesiribacter andamanensis]EMR01739.1 2-C-methyl-D-erythritol 4-phosphate cytidylyltransferase 1 [Cesiribacter andamanensis AMV16]
MDALSSSPLYAVIVAGGSGSRMQSSLPKQFLPLQGKPVLMHTLQAFASLPQSVELVLVLPEVQMAYWQQLCRQHRFTLPHQLVAGGNSRFQSVKRGLEKVPDKALVAIHDGVRPLIEGDIILRAYQLAAEKGTAVVAVPLKDSIRRLQADGSSQSSPREEYRLVQTPQTFRAEAIRSAYAREEQPHFTDCASVAEAAGLHIHLTEGSYRNLKITTPEDLLLAEALLQNGSLHYRN